jgi:hypothetical protein
MAYSICPEQRVILPEMEAAGIARYKGRKKSS